MITAKQRDIMLTCALAVAALCASMVTGVRADADAPLIAERAHAAAEFVDSVGINVHLAYNDTGYGNVPRVTALLRDLGVRHLRDGVMPGRNDVCADDKALAAEGFRFTYITVKHPTVAQLSAWATCVGGATEAFEGLNEYDLNHALDEDDWADNLRATQHALYNSVKASPALAALPVLAPSLTTEGAYKRVGDLSADSTAGNMHDYFSFHEPETGGYGLGGYGSLAYDLHAAREVSPSKPIVATETGYGTDRAKHSVDDATQATYLPRLLLMHLAAGVPRTYAYELLDEGPEPFDHYGIVDRSFAPKPAYIALASLIAALNDGHDAFVPGTLRYAIDNAGNDVHHVLLQKKNGAYALAIWIGTPSCDMWSHAIKAVTTRDVTLRLATPVKSADVRSYGNDWRLHTAALAPGSVLHLTISDRVSLVDVVTAPS